MSEAVQPPAKKAKAAGPLGDLLDSMDTLAQGTAKKTETDRRLHPFGQDVRAEFHKYLTHVRRTVATMDDRASVEIEARLGLVLEAGRPVRAYPQVPGSGAVTITREDMRERRFEFRTGVSAPSYDDITTRLAVAGGRAERSEERVYSYEGDTRCIVRSGRLRREKKEKIPNLERTFALPGAPYDLRITVSTEKELDPPGLDPSADPTCNQHQDPVAAGFETARSKKRDSLVGYRLPFMTKPQPGTAAAANEPPALWRVDMTRVASASGGSGGGGAAGGGSNGGRDDDEEANTLEVEMEMQTVVQALWTDGAEDDAKHEGETELLTQHLVSLVHMLNPLEPPSTILDPPDEKDKGLVAAAIARLATLRPPFGGYGGGGSGGGGRGGGGGGVEGGEVRFPGAMPSNLCRAHVAAVQEGSYFVSEKTDGVRYLMVVCQSADGRKGCVLVDRKMHAFAVEGGDVIAAHLAAAAGSAAPGVADAVRKAAGGTLIGTVLDGELVHHRGRNRAVFMAFDLLALGQTSEMGSVFAMRFGLARDVVLKAYDEGCRTGTVPADQHLPLVAKRWFPRLEIGELWKFIHERDGERLYQDNEGRLHKTDGVIFQPNAPYQPGSDRRLLKWKWKDLASVDLKVGRRGGGSGELKFETAGPNDLPIDMSDPRQGQPIVNMAPQDLMRLQADIKARPSCTIAEVALHEATGLWRYLGLRPDKTKPNFLTTVMGTLLEMAEGMSPQELQYRMMCRTPADDDWAKQINKMGASAIKYRREKLAIEQANARR